MLSERGNCRRRRHESQTLHYEDERTMKACLRGIRTHNTANVAE